MEILTDEELHELFSIVEDRAFYGPDEIVYERSEEGVLTHSIYRKVRDEAKKRGFWWAK